jgi:hypothetical protein
MKIPASFSLRHAKPATATKPFLLLSGFKNKTTF